MDHRQSALETALFARDGSDSSPYSGLSSETESSDAPITAAQQERIQWHSMLASVIRGQIFSGEKVRMNAAAQTGEQIDGLHMAIWMGIRARLHGTTVKEEELATLERRVQLGAEAVEAVLRFQVSAAASSDLNAAFVEVHGVLNRLHMAKSHYPTHRHFYEDRPSALNPVFSVRRDVLCAWSSLLTSLRQHRSYFDTSMENFKEDKARSSLAQESVVNSNAGLVERMLKDESLVRAFEHEYLSVVPVLAERAKDVQTDMAPLLESMRLPSLEALVVPLVSFPFEFMQSLLRSHVEHALLLRNPALLILDEMSEQLRGTIGLACALKSRYEPICASMPDGRWMLHSYATQSYHAAVLDAVRSLFQLMQWKLSLAAKDRYFQETDLLRSQWDLFGDVSRTIDGGALLIAEQLCVLTNDALRLGTVHLRVLLRNSPLSSPRRSSPSSPGRLATSEQGDHRPTDDILIMCRQLLDNLRVRYWKLANFVSRLVQVVGGCMEYALQHGMQSRFISALADSGHFMVDSTWHKEREIMIIPSPSLRGRENRISRLLAAAFTADCEEDSVHDEAGDNGDYVLLWRPAADVVWPGAFVALQVPAFDVGLIKSRVRLVSTGYGSRLHAATDAFLDVFEPEGNSNSNFHSIPGMLHCVDESRARSRHVNRRLRGIAVASGLLAQSTMEMAVQVWKALRGSVETHSLVGEFFVRAAKHMDLARRGTSHPSSTANFVISWITFVLDDAGIGNHRTLGWALQALEFTKRQTRVILGLSTDEFRVLQETVSNCMGLLVEYYDVGSVKKLRRDAEFRAESYYRGEVNGAGTPSSSSDEDSPLSFQARMRRALDAVDKRRSEIASDLKLKGRVLDQDVPEDNSIVLLASATSNISMKWQQGRHLGSGASGSVYLAVDMESGSVMAVKEIKFQHASSVGVSDLQSRFKKELDVMEMLRHPNIVDYYGIEVHRDKVYIFEEFCEGGSLEDLLAYGPIEEQMCQIYAMQMLEGLAYLHANDVAHRDVKPGNILLDTSGCLKFVDFGAAAVLTGGQGMDQRSRTPRATMVRDAHGDSTIKVGADPTGTPMYMAPEVIKTQLNGGRLGAMDLWAVGCVLLRCLTGRQPWPGLDHEWAIMFHIAVATEPPPLPDASECSMSGVEFLRACLVIKAADRPNAQELLDHAWICECRAMLLEYEG